MLNIPFVGYDFFGYLSCGLVVVGGLQLLTGFPPVFGADLGAFGTAAAILAVYVAGQMAATPAKAIFEDVLVHRILRPPSEVLFYNVARVRQRPVRRLLFRGYHRALPTAIGQRVRERAASEGIRDMGESLFLHVCYSNRIRADERTMKKLETFVAQFGFARNLAFTCIVFGLALLVKARITHELDAAYYGASGVVVGGLLVFRFLMFYRQYSFEMFNRYAAEDAR
jgi:hypothetical protein